MSDSKNKRTKRVHVRFTDAEFSRIENQFKRSTCRQLSEYVRNVLLSKPIHIRHRNASLDDAMTELIALRTALNAIGNNFNQSVKKLHTLTDVSDIHTWLLMNENSKKILLQQVAEIKAKIHQINDAWLHE